MKWFVHYDEKILGPFSKEHILQDLKKGNISYSSYIWSKGQVEWMSASDWENNLDTIMAKSEEPGQKWRLKTPEGIQENLSFNQVLEKLKTMEDFQMVATAPAQSQEWMPIYHSYPFMEALNLSRRSHLRAPLMGLAKVIHKESRFSYIVKTATIGQGGLGVYGLGANFQPGDQVSLKIESIDLCPNPLNLNGIIAYNTAQGFVGIRFDELHAEPASIIVNYVRRFREVEEEELKEAA